MLPLSEELRQAIVEIDTWARLHKTEDDTDRGIWRALVTLKKVLKVVQEQEATG